MAVVTKTNAHAGEELRHGQRHKAHHDEEDDTHDDEEEEEEEAYDSDEETEYDEEGVDDWDTIIPPQELEEMENGPSTYYVGGFSICPSLTEALSLVHYTQDCILIFPGLHDGTLRVVNNAAYTAQMAASTSPFVASESGVVETIVLDEARLGGLRILSVPFARGKAGGYAEHYFARHTSSFTSSSLLSSSHAPADARSTRRRANLPLEHEEQDDGADVPPSVPDEEWEALSCADGRGRVGPWFDYMATASSGGAVHTDAHPASRMRPDGAHRRTPASCVPSSRTTWCASSDGSPCVTAAQIYADWITPTEMSITHYPVLVARVILCHGTAEALVMYEPHDEDDEDYDDDPAAAKEDRRARRRGGASAWSGYAPHAILLAGLVILHGVECHPLTRSVVQHCILGLPSVAMSDGHTRLDGGARDMLHRGMIDPDTNQVHTAQDTDDGRDDVEKRGGRREETCGSTVVCHPFTEVRLERCIVYGGRDCVVYVYPRGAPRLCSCVLDGPSAECTSLEAMTRAARVRRQHRGRHVAPVGGNPLPPHGLNSTQAGTAGGRLGARGGEWGQDRRAEVNALTRRTHDSAGVDRNREDAVARRTSYGNHPLPLPASSTSVALRTTPLARVSVPAQSHTAVALYCDDGDARLYNCVLGQTRLGLLLRDACAGTRVMSCAVAGVTEVGLCCCGMGGAARVGQCELRGCGWECVLVKGPSESDIATAEAAFRAGNSAWEAVTADTSRAMTAQDGKDLYEYNDQDETESQDSETMDWVARARRLRDECRDEESGSKSVMPVFAQHPVIRDCRLVGMVRFQGVVRDGAMWDNVIYEPREMAADKTVNGVRPIDHSSPTASCVSASPTAALAHSLTAAGHGSSGMGASASRVSAPASAAQKSERNDRATRSALLINSSCGVACAPTMHGFHVVGIDGAEAAR